MATPLDDRSLEARVTAALDALGADYDVVACDPELADTAEFCAHYGYPVEIAANAIVVASKRDPRRFAACVALGSTRLDVNKRVRGLIGERKVSFASPEDTREVTGMELGGVSPFGLPDGLPLYVDAAVVEPARVIVGAGSRSAKLLVDPEVFGRVPGAEIVTGLAIPAPG